MWRGMSDEFLAELKEYIRVRYRACSEEAQRLYRDRQQRSGAMAFSPFGPDESDERETNEMWRKEQELLAKCEVYNEIFVKVAREDELTKWFEEVQSTLP